MPTMTVLPVQNGEEYFAIVTVEKLQLEARNDEVDFCHCGRTNCVALESTSGKTRTNALEVDDFETADGSRWSNAKSISSVMLSVEIVRKRQRRRRGKYDS